MKYDSVVLSGGGSKGILQLGVLHHLYTTKKFDMTHVKEYAGSSIGAVISLLLSCGFTPMEIFYRTYTAKSFFNAPSSITDVFNGGGIFEISSFTNKVRNMVLEKFNHVPTLAEIKRKMGIRLIVTTSNVSRMGVEYLTPETHPDMNCIDAINMSCSLPLIFQRFAYKGEYYVDGGFTDNFPLKMVNDGKKKILGVKISVGGNTPLNNDFTSYFYRVMIMSMTTMTNNACKNIEGNVEIVETSWSGNQMIQLTMTSEDKMNMFQKGIEDAKMNKRRGDCTAPPVKEPIDESGDVDIDWMEGLQSVEDNGFFGGSSFNLFLDD